MNYTKTYSDLAELINRIFASNNDHLNLSQKSLLKALSEKFDCEMRFLLGVYFFEMETIDALQIFRSNRYFIDSVGIKLLPSLEEVDLFNQKLHDGKNIEYHLREIINNATDFILNANKFTNLKLTPLQKKFLESEGYLIIENVIPTELCDELQEITLEIANQEASSDKGGYIYGSGNMQRIYNLIAKNLIFQNLIANPICHEVMRLMFQRSNFHDKYYLTSFHANLLYKDAEPQIWHIDANVPDPIPQWIIRSNSNFIIHDYYKDNGATEIIPGSHKFFKKPDLKQINSDFTESKFIEAPKGSIAFWHGHLWHRSGQNITNKPRIALLGAYAASFLREVSMEENPFLSIPKPMQDSLSPEIKKLLGWNHGLKNYS